MAFRLPSFDITCAIYRGGAGVYGTPDVTSPCNLTPGKRVLVGAVARNVTNSTPMELLLPPLTDIRPEHAVAFVAVSQDWVEVPAGSQRWYTVEYVDDIAKGFANEHRFAIIVMVRGPLPFLIAGATTVPWPLP